MSCCDKPKYLGKVRASKPVVDGNNLVIELPDFCCAIEQGDYADMCIYCNFDYPQCIGNVIIVANGVNFVGIKYGVVKSDQVKKRNEYRIVFGTEFNTATFTGNLCCSKFPYPSVEVPADSTKRLNSKHDFLPNKAVAK